MLCAALAVSTGCERRPPRPADPALAASGVRLEQGEVHADWVALYDPERAWNGFTLALYRKQVPILIDMNGRLAHAWPEVRARSRIRLVDGCSLLAIASAGRRVQQFSWSGELEWEHSSGDLLPHHDVVRLENGNTLLVVLDEERRTDELLEVDRSGRVVWEWRAGERLARWLAERRPRGRANLTHINSVQELPENPWFDAGDRRFRPGNLLISARNLDALFVIERPGGDVVWSLEEGLDQQHEALMNPPGLPRPGHVLLFNNNTFTSRRSAVEEVDPRDESRVWEYRAPGFFTATKGSQQALANGNVLVTSSRGWRAFEVTRGGRIVWQWTPPFELQRPTRYPADQCPQLAELGDPTGPAVQPAPGYAYVDRELYELADDHDVGSVRVAGERRDVLKFASRCRELLLPAAARLELGYGLSPERQPDPEAAARFTASWSDGDDGEVLLDETLAGDAGWRRVEIPLVSGTPRRVDLCLAIEELADGGGGRADRFAYWDHASVEASDGAAELGELQLSAEELEERRRHLRAMGYVD